MGLSGVQRTLKFTKYFKDNNWEPTVITTGKVGYFAFDESLLKEAEKAGINIVRTESINPHSLLKKRGIIQMPSTWLMKFLGRISKTFFIPDNKKYWSKKAAKIGSKLLTEKKFDAIYISVPPFSAIAPFTKLKEIFDIPLFVDYRDAWLNNQFRFYPTPYHRYKHKKIEDTVLRKVDRIIVVNRIIKENLLKAYQFLNFNDIDIIPHGYDSEDFESIVELPKDNAKMVISYSGIFYENITPKYLLQAFKKLTVEHPEIASNIELHFIGHFKKENRKLVRKLKLENFVREIGYLAHTEVIKRIKSSDILWLMLPNNGRMENVTPGKLFEYFGSRKPIVACLPEGIAKSTAEKYKSSFISTPSNVDELKNTILKVHKLYITNKLPSCNNEYVDELDRKVQVEQLTKIFQFYLKAD
jgi:hypothetical protein